MPNITLSLPRDLYEEMKLRKEIKWSEVIRKLLREYISELKREKIKEAVPIAEIRETFKDILRDIEETNFEKGSEELRREEMKRIEIT